MKTTFENSVSVSEIKNDFSKVEKLVNENGSAVLLENNSPKYMVIDVSQYTENANTFDAIAQQILNENMEAFMELAK